MRTTQITVRIADDAVAFLDAEASETHRSRAAIITRALRREKRRRLYEEEAIRLAALPALTPEERAEEDAIARWAAVNAAEVWSDLD